MFKHALLRLSVIALLASNVAAADAHTHGKMQVNINEPKFQAAQPWDTATMTIIGGISGFAIGALATAQTKDVGIIIPVGALAALIGAAILGIPTYQYSQAYKANNGLDIRGSSAANNAAGVQAWINYYGKATTLHKDAEGKNPLMYAAANGACQSGEVILFNMPKTEKVVESTTQSEATTAAVAWPILTNDKWPEKTTTTATTTKEVKTIDAQDKSGKTAIFTAAVGEHLHMMQLLYANGADASIPNNKGKDIKELAKSSAIVNQFYEQE